MYKDPTASNATPLTEPVNGALLGSTRSQALANVTVAPLREPLKICVTPLPLFANAYMVLSPAIQTSPFWKVDIAPPVKITGTVVMVTLLVPFERNLARYKLLLSPASIQPVPSGPIPKRTKPK